MEFNNTPPKWDEQGAEPTEELQTKGFQAGYKPPAPYFNYLFNKITTCLKEIQEKLKGHAEDTSNPHKITKAQVGLGNVDNTADADKSVKYATSAGTCTGNAATATKATQDGDGNVIADTYTRQDEIGSTDISTIGNGTVTGAISLLNSELANSGVGTVCGGKNLFNHYEYVPETGFKTQTKNGVTVYFNSDNALVINGTASAKTTFYFGYKFFTPTENVRTHTKYLQGEWYDGDVWKGVRGAGGIIPAGFSKYSWHITLNAGDTFDNEIIPIMITKAEYPYGIPYEPYYYSNEQLFKYHAAKSSIYGDTVVSMGRKANTTVGDYSFAFGNYETASGDYSCAFGEANIASGDYSLAFGDNTNATAKCSKAFGSFVEASGKFSSVHGEGVKASGIYSHAKGYGTTASGAYSTAEGYMTTASGGNGSHAEGMNTTASGDYTHAEGYNTVASNTASHAEGRATTANGDYSHAEGFKTTALTNQHAQGHYNNTTNATANSTSGTSTGTAFVIGNGSSSDNTSNAFRVTGEGATVAKKAYSTTGADYAEFREWLDGNEDNEDRRGYFVTLVGKKIRKANAGEYIRGVVSALPSVIGNYDEEWMGRYIRDDFGAFITETFEYEDEVITGYTEDGEPIIETATKTGTKWKENPEYDKEKEYIPREERKEWDAVGMVGELSVRDDGTCKVNGYCKCADGGIATNAEVSEYSYLTPIYRVVDRVTENIVKIEI